MFKITNTEESIVKKEQNTSSENSDETILTIDKDKQNKKQIKSFKLNTILDNSFYKNRRIDFLNIDLEGADLDALKSKALDL